MEGYIYQTVHTINHYPLHVAAHCRLLERAFMDVLFRPLILDDAAIAIDIIELLRSSKVPKEVSVHVEIRIDIDAHVEYVISEVSIYEGYALRSISPSAYSLTFSSPFGLHNTSARREVIRFSNSMAQNLGCDVAVECYNGVALSISGGAIFGITNRDAVASISLMSVERDMVVETIRSFGIYVAEREITKQELIQFEELFIADHYGVTSISRCGEHLYLDSMAHKVAEALTQPWY